MISSPQHIPGLTILIRSGTLSKIPQRVLHIMSIGILTLYLYLPGCKSLKEKRRHIKPVLSRLHREFNISAAEIDRQDMWRESVIACVMVSNKKVHTQRVLQSVVNYFTITWPDLQILSQRTELI